MSFLIINSTAMLPCLDSSDFDLLLDMFNRTIRALGMRRFNPDIQIEFSDERKNKKCGSYSINEIKNLIRGKWKINEEIDRILAKTKSYSDYRNKTFEILCGAICKNNARTNYEAVKNTIDDWFDNIKYSYYVLGEYVNTEKKIILYTKNIGRDLMPGRSLEEHFEEVFAHELFHAYHYDGDPSELIFRSDYTSQVVKESLASAFEWYYCIVNNILGADELKASWNEYPVFSYPYAGARYLIDNQKINQSEFTEVFDRSIGDMDWALRTLLNRNDFYRIKNAVRIRKGTQNNSSYKRHSFKLNQSKSFVMETQNGYAFAPDTKKYADMKKIHVGDVVLSIFGGELKAIGIAKSDCYKSTNAHGRREDGLYLDVQYFVFPAPIDISCFRNQSCYPIRRNEPYIRAFDEPDFIRLMLKESKSQLSAHSLLFDLIEQLL